MSRLKSPYSWLFFFFHSWLLKKFLVVLGLCCWSGFSLDAMSRGCSLVEMLGLLTAVVPLVVEHRL